MPFSAHSRVLVIAALVASPGVLRAQDVIRFRVSTATQFLSEPSLAAPPRRILEPNAIVLLAINAEESGPFVRVQASSEYGWVVGADLRVDPDEIPIDSSLIERGARGGGGGAGGRGGGTGIQIRGFPPMQIPQQLVLSKQFGTAPEPPTVQRFIDGSWMLRARMLYAVRGGPAKLEVPNGFVTDFASVPVYLRAIVTSNAVYSAASVIHDFLYWDQSCTRGQADRLFRIAMQETQGIGNHTAFVFYWAVRLAGGFAWDGNARDRSGGRLRVVPPPHDIVPPDRGWARYRSDLVQLGIRDTKWAAVTGELCSEADR